ncbi:zonadhesin-like, partial [Mustelus asterias]
MCGTRDLPLPGIPVREGDPLPVTDGIRQCKPEVFRSCRIAGDPHYRTFDGYRHHFQGRYTYTLTKTIAPGDLPPFNIDGQNVRRIIFSRVSFLQAVHVEVYGHSATLMKRGRLVVDGIRVQPPYQPREGLMISQRARALQLHTDFGLTVNFDGRSSAEIILPSTYRDRVRGLCGNFDGRKYNEFMKPDGSVVRSVRVFGKSWRVPRRRGAPDDAEMPRLHKREVGELDSGFNTESCSPQQLALMNSTDYCGALSSPVGPFTSCHSTVDPTSYQENCVFDLCAIYNDTQLLCERFEDYALRCQEQGVQLNTWRQRTGCGIECPRNSVYKVCTHACPATCADLSAPSECTSPCLEGCECERGFVLSGSECVPFNQCGCSFRNQYYQLHEHFILNKCQQQCVCSNTQSVQCRQKQCPSAQICTVYNYTLGCFTSGPCLSSPCQNGGTCHASGTNFTCDCALGFSGRLCETEDVIAGGPCLSSPCQNGGTCHAWGTNFTCDCALGFSGRLCETEDVIA